MHRSKLVRVRRGAVALAIIAGLSGFGVPTAGAAQAETAQTVSAPGAVPGAVSGAVPGLWVVKTSGETLLEAVARQAATDPAYRAQARRTVAAWVARSRAGLPVTVLDEADRPVTATAPALRDLGSALARTTVPARVPAGPGASAQHEPGAKVSTTVDVRPMADGNDPNSFPVRGAPGAGRSFWQDMPLTVSGAFCTGSCSVTDKYTSRIRITPGPTSAKVDSTNLYSPNGRHFGNQHFELWAICRGSICADTDTGQLSGNSSHLVRYTDRHSNVITIAVTLWVYFNPTANYVPDGAKTSDCAFPSTGSICRF